MTSSRSEESVVLDSLFAAAQSEQPEELALRRTLVSLGLLSAAAAGTATATTAHAAVVASVGAGGGGALKASMAVAAAGGRVVGMSGLGGASAAETLGIAGGTALAKGASSSIALLFGKWLALGFVSGSVALGVGAVSTSAFDTPGKGKRQAEAQAVGTPRDAVARTGKRASPLLRSPQTVDGLSERGSSERRLKPHGATAPSAPAGSARVVPRAGAGDVLEPDALAMTLQTAGAQNGPDSVGTPPDAPRLALEVAALENARKALRAGNATGAVASARQYREAYPNGVFAAEARYIAMEAELRVGNIDAAKREATVILNRFPSSAQAVKAQRVLSSQAE